MRDSQRIDELIELISQIWKQNPDLRFLQLIYILQSGFSQSDNNVGKVESTGEDGLTKIGYDLFNTEDDLFIEYLRETTKNGM